MSANLLPQFSNIDTTTFVERLDGLLQSNLKQIDTLLIENKGFNWENLMSPMEDMDDKLERFWSPLSHLHSVMNSRTLRDCYQACLPKLSAYESALGQNLALYNALR